MIKWPHGFLLSSITKINEEHAKFIIARISNIAGIHAGCAYDAIKTTLHKYKYCMHINLHYMCMTAIMATTNGVTLDEKKSTCKTISIIRVFINDLHWFLQYLIIILQAPSFTAVSKHSLAKKNSVLL